MAEFEPYSFEPMRDFSDSDGESTADGQNELARRGNTSWCKCEHCENWENQQERECVCCQEIDKAMTTISGEILLIERIINFMKRFIHCLDLFLVFSLMNFQLGIAAFLLYDLDLEDDPPIRCISRHPVFETVCLRREVLEMAIVGLSQARGIRAPRELANMYVPHQ